MGTKKIGLTLMVILLSSSSVIFAQGYVESALLFSRTKPGGSARIQGLGGTQIALGGDYSSSLSNPAGLGMFNKSEVTLSTGLSFYNTTSRYQGGGPLDESTSKINIPGISLVFNIPNDENTDFVSGSVSVSMSRTNDFNRAVRYSGVNPESSIIDSFIDNAWGNSTSQFDEGAYNYNTPTGLAYYSYLIGPNTLLPDDYPDEDYPDDGYFSDVLLNDFPLITQREEIETKGSASQVNIAYGANYKDILFLGAGIGITSLKFTSQKFYTENYDDTSSPVESMALNEELSISGTGFNLTIGAIVRPVSFMQIGASLTTPTYHAISESYSASMNSVWDEDFDYGDGTFPGDFNNDLISTDEVISDYSLTTPLKVSAGIAFISKFGFIAVDLEQSNPAKARYGSSTDGLSFGNENDGIKASFKRALTYRIGGEGRYKIFRIRAGYSLQGNTLSNEVNFNNEIKTMSGGLGIKKSKFSVDFALVQSTSKSFYNPYTTELFGTPVVDLEDKITTGLITVGYSF